MATANEKAIKSACDWAVKIAKDNNFHYGRTKWAHKYGCYFCGTQSAKKNAAPASQKSEVSKTYCCNPFVVAAYVHGAGVAKKCGSGGLTVPLAGGSTKNLKKYNFKKVTKPKAVSGLKKGDILLTPTHAMLYVGDGKVSHAKHHDNGVKGSYWNESITTEKIPAKQWSRVKEVWRYSGKGKFMDDTKYKVDTKNSNLNVRKTSDPKSPIIGSLKKGTVITVTEIKGEMAHYSGGWVALKYLDVL